MESRYVGAWLALVVVLAGCVGAAPGDERPLAETERATAVGASGAATLEVHFIDVGQASSTLVVGPGGETMLVDSGDFADRGERVLSYLERRNVTRIDALVTTHADADHIGGHAAVIDHFETEGDGVGAIYDPGIAASTRTYERYLDAVEEHGVPLYETRAGDAISLGNASVEVLGPPDPYLGDGDRNENSVVLRVAFGETRVLLTGDAEAAGERYLVTTYGERLNATLLAAGHHGSETSTGGPLLDAVDPSYAVVSSAYDSPYGHPHEETLRRLADREVATYWTAVHGTVVATTDGRDLTVAPAREATTDPLALRSAPPVRPDEGAPTEGGGATPVLADGGVEAATGLTLVDVNADAAGDDRENLNDEYLVFRNDGPDELDLGGWTVRDEADHAYAFPDGTALSPGERLTLRTGTGTDAATDRYWGSGAPVWNNGGDTVFVYAANGTLVLEEEYE